MFKYLGVWRMSSQNLAYKLRRIRENFRNTHAEMITELEDYGIGDERLDVDAITQFESGERVPSDPVLLAYSKYSGIPVSVLTDDGIAPFYERST